MRRRWPVWIAGLTLVPALVLWKLTPVSPATTCDPTRGLRQLARVNARDSGYLLPAPDAGYFPQAVYDLIQGRVGFFEVEETPGSYTRYQLADVHSAACIERRRADAELAGLPMPAGRCVAKAQISVPVSRYEVSGYSSNKARIPRAVAVRDRDSGALLAEYRWPRLAFLTRHAGCARKALRDPGHPLWNITSFVFRDRWGSTFETADLERIHDEQAQGAEVPERLPPPAWVRRQMAEAAEPVQAACHLPGWMGETEVHTVELERGPLEMEARLDAESHKAGMAILDVHAPEKSVVVIAKSSEPTVWHVHESRRSNLVAMLVSGHHGQAVVGLTPYTRILLSTELHNPYTNCTRSELRQIEQRITGHYGVTSQQTAADGQDPNGVRFVIGEPMPEGGELFHYILGLADFEVRDD